MIARFCEKFCEPFFRVAAAERVLCPNSRSKAATADASSAVIFANARAREPARAASM
jgi:hypothetical protein